MSRDLGVLLIDANDVSFSFNTVQPSTGAPFTLAGTPALAVRINGGATVASGLTLSVDHDDGGGAHTGEHRVTFAKDDATLALADGDRIEIVATAGTVDGVSIAGRVLAYGVMSDGSLPTQAQTDVQTAANAALVANHLDHLFAATYDPANKPGQADALLNELVESDGGVSRLTSNAIEQVWAVAQRTLTALDEDSTTIDIDAAIRAAIATELARIDVAVSTRLATAGYTAPLDAAAVRTALGMASADLDDQLDALPTAAEIVTAVFAKVIENGLTFNQIIGLLAAVALGKASGMDTTSAVFRDLADTLNRVAATVDDHGNRSAVTLNTTGL